MDVSCAGCGADGEFPEGEAHEPREGLKAYCPICSILLDEGVREEELKTTIRRKEVTELARNEIVAGALAQALTGELFKEAWAENKDGLKRLSRKDLARSAYRQGMADALIFVLQKGSGGIEAFLRECAPDGGKDGAQQELI